MNDKEPQILQARHEFIERFCREKGWDRKNLTFNQILQIRLNPEWQSAGQPTERELDGATTLTGTA